MNAASSSTDVSSLDSQNSLDAGDIIYDVTDDQEAFPERNSRNWKSQHANESALCIILDDSDSDTDPADDSGESDLRSKSTSSDSLLRDNNNNAHKNLTHAEAHGGQTDTFPADKQTNYVVPNLFSDVQKAMEMVINADPNMLYERLEIFQHLPSKERVFRVVSELLNKNVNHENTVSNEMDVAADSAIEQLLEHGRGDHQVVADVALDGDAALVSDVCPQIPLQEIMKLLKSHSNNPNRVEMVIDILTSRQADADVPVTKADTELGNTTICNSEKVTFGIVPEEGVPESDIPPIPDIEPQPSTSGENVPTAENDVAGQMRQWAMLCEMLPDADPNFLLHTVEDTQGNLDDLMKQVSVYLEKRNYPKLTEAVQRHEQLALKRKYMERDFTVEEFLEMFEDPVTFFYNIERPVSENYKAHVIVQLSNDFPLVYKQDLNTTLQKYNYHLAPAYRYLAETHGGSKEPSGKRRKCLSQRCKKKASPYQQLPMTFDESFYKELVFLEMEDAVKEHIKQREESRNLKLESARANNELITCGCCYDDELLLDDMLSCADGHLFCKECIRRSTEENIGQGKLKFPCLTAECTTEFPLKMLQLALKSTVFSNVLRRLQEEEIKQADIPDLVSCPFCSFCAIMPNPDDKVFKCLNPECLKESCRLCREVNHIPLRCDEVEKEQEVKMRTYIEDKMTDSLLRTCPRCQRRFIKEDGCNKMTCSCGQIMCYICRQPIKDYSHFGEGKCPQFSNDQELHLLEVKTGAEKAKQKFIEEHPELDMVELKHDPTKDLSAGTIPGAVNAGSGVVPVLENGEIVFRQNQRPPVLPGVGLRYVYQQMAGNMQGRVAQYFDRLRNYPPPAHIANNVPLPQQPRAYRVGPVPDFVPNVDLVVPHLPDYAVIRNAGHPAPAYIRNAPRPPPFLPPPPPATVQVPAVVKAGPRARRAIYPEFGAPPNEGAGAGARAKAKIVRIRTAAVVDPFHVITPGPAVTKVSVADNTASHTRAAPHPEFGTLPAAGLRKRRPKPTIVEPRNVVQNVPVTAPTKAMKIDDAVIKFFGPMTRPQNTIPGTVTTTTGSNIPIFNAFGIRPGMNLQPVWTTLSPIASVPGPVVVPARVGPTNASSTSGRHSNSSAVQLLTNVPDNSKVQTVALAVGRLPHSHQLGGLDSVRVTTSVAQEGEWPTHTLTNVAAAPPNSSIVNVQNSGLMSTASSALSNHAASGLIRPSTLSAARNGAGISILRPSILRPNTTGGTPGIACPVQPGASLLLNNNLPARSVENDPLYPHSSLSKTGDGQLPNPKKP